MFTNQNYSCNYWAEEWQCAIIDGVAGVTHSDYDIKDVCLTSR